MNRAVDIALPAPSRHQRARGTVDVVMASRDGQPALRRLFQSGCGKALLPRTHGGMPEAVLINTSGGITGGDRLEYRLAAETGASLVATTQAAERVYRASAGTGRLDTHLTLGPGARLHWLPQETILFDGGRLERRLEIDMAPDAELIALETVALGRAAMGEEIVSGSLTDSWRLRRGGRLAHAEALRFGDDPLRSRGALSALDGAGAFATLLHAAPGAHEALEPVRAGLDALADDVIAGATTKPDILILRLVAPGLAPLRTALIGLLATLRGAPLPRVWAI